MGKARPSTIDTFIVINTLVVVVLVVLTVTGCVTPLEDFSKIHPGMEKSDVLYLMGSPQYTQRSLDFHIAFGKQIALLIYEYCFVR